MHFVSASDTEKNMIFVYFLLALVFLEVTFLGLSSFYSIAVRISSQYTVIVGMIIIFDSMFLIDGIMSKNDSQLCFYPIVYCYSLSVNFIGEIKNAGLSFAFKISQIATLLIRGVLIFYTLQRFKAEFAWYHFKKLGPSTALNGK